MYECAKLLICILVRNALMTEVLVFSKHSTPRLRYTLDWVLSNRLGLNYKITDSESEFISYPHAKINYGNTTLTNFFTIECTTILYETSINENFGEIGEWDGLKTFFKTSGKEVPFDIFGAVFYCISRMEEYGINTLDSHERYSPSNSILFKLGVLSTPLVDWWLVQFKKVFSSFFPLLQFKSETYRLTNTFDIDQAFCYVGKGFYRTLGGLCKDFWRLDFRRIKERIEVLSGFKKDPYDTFEYILQQQKDHALNTIVFILLADYSTYDKNITRDNTRFKQRMKQLQADTILGIHPSYFSGTSPSRIKMEIKRLVDVQRMPVTHSRQHYLRFVLPDTFRLLVDSGIRHEYSLGYAEVVGFRAGTSHSFHWFDIEKNESSSLEMHPSCVMDVTLKNYLLLSPDRAVEKLRTLIEEVKKVNGTFLPIWHNESISNHGEWGGWREVYESMLEIKK